MIVYPVPEQGFHVGDRLMAPQAEIADPADLPTITTSYEVFRKRVQRAYAVLDAVAGANIIRVYPERNFCRACSGRCIASEGECIYFESDHYLAPLGARLVISDIAAKLRLMPESPTESR